MGKAVDKLKRAKRMIHDSLIVGAREYAISRQDGSKGVVDQHYTAGNDQRQGWPPLSRSYFLAKQRGISKQGMKAGVFKGSKLDKNASFQSTTGTLRGIGTATNLPMLVRTGALRKAVNGRQAALRVQGNLVVITFTGLPEYATYLHTGTAKMPMRSPAKPNRTTDRDQIIAAMRRFIQRASGTGGAVAVSQTTVPGIARTEN